VDFDMTGVSWDGVGGMVIWKVHSLVAYMYIGLGGLHCRTACRRDYCLTSSTCRHALSYM
jgi:hypothetical protein